MKKITRIVFVLIIGAIVFLIVNKQYSLTKYQIPFYSVPDGQVRVDFVNNSDQNIQSISLFPSTNKIENIQVGERRTVTFKQSGEGTYQFIVNFDSGDQLVESERYIERGYFITENIHNNQVITNY